MLILSKIPLTNKVIALLASTISIVLVIYYSKLIPWLKDFTEKNIRTFDGVIDDSQVFILKITMAFFICIGFLISIILVFNLHEKFNKFLATTFDLKKIEDTFLTDIQISSKTFSKKVFIYLTVFVLLFHMKLLLTGEPEEESIVEHISSFFFLLSTVLLILVLFNLKYFKAPKTDKRIVKYWILLCALALLFVFAEEISYGQHIFNWESSGVFKAQNFQNETNLHNFVNPFFRFIYPLSGFGLFAVLNLIWFFYKAVKPQWLQLLTPHKSLFVLVFYMAASTFRGHSESFEFMFSIFTGLYAYRVLLYLKRLKTIKQNIQ